VERKGGDNHTIGRPSFGIHKTDTRIVSLRSRGEWYIWRKSVALQESVWGKLCIGDE
jgi:hypothetical protein